MVNFPNKIPPPPPRPHGHIQRGPVRQQRCHGQRRQQPGHRRCGRGRALATSHRAYGETPHLGVQKFQGAIVLISTESQKQTKRHEHPIDPDPDPPPHPHFFLGGGGHRGWRRFMLHHRSEARASESIPLQMLPNAMLAS